MDSGGKVLTSNYAHVFKEIKMKKVVMVVTLTGVLVLTTTCSEMTMPVMAAEACCDLTNEEGEG